MINESLVSSVWRLFRLRDKITYIFHHVNDFQSL